nr:immunoglobulin heavy chain junction region [Macaca mulatta]MOV38128.1 immunoglobulin heavy chain junction region [Macaca mulatta]MOV41076.1 immunoglobulin heavy chain junction region [Macaca mulatta]MOV45846.1 immunoglobulin heavy chain junction region [Macaca mulatta]MOV46183.1 immunoglobulin heavy chain junction region [Macaca mulatta]
CARDQFSSWTYDYGLDPW